MLRHGGAGGVGGGVNNLEFLTLQQKVTRQQESHVPIEPKLMFAWANSDTEAALSLGSVSRTHPNLTLTCRAMEAHCI